MRELEEILKNPSMAFMFGMYLGALADVFFLPAIIAILRKASLRMILFFVNLSLPIGFLVLCPSGLGLAIAALLCCWIALIVWSLKSNVKFASES